MTTTRHSYNEISVQGKYMHCNVNIICSYVYSHKWSRASVELEYSYNFPLFGEDQYFQVKGIQLWFLHYDNLCEFLGIWSA